MKLILYIIIGSYLVRAIMKLFIKKPIRFDYYFGVPGCGKTTFAAWLSKSDFKRNRDVYSNVPIKGAYHVEKSDIGVYLIENGRLIQDEASIDWNNRKFKTMSSEAIEFYKMHRHYKLHVSIFSQSWDDCDVTLRRLSTRYFLVEKSFFPLFIKRRLILKKIKINKETHQPEEQYYFAFLGFKYIFSPSLWSMFDTEERKNLPKRKFEKYGVDNE